MANLKDCSICENNGNYQKCTLCLGCTDHDYYIPKTVISKDDCEYFGLRTINKPCYTCTKFCMYSPAYSQDKSIEINQPTNNTDGVYKPVQSKKYGVGELPYLGGPLNWVHIFASEEDADAYYNLVKDSCMKSKLNVHIVKFTVNDEIKLKDGHKVED